MTFGVDYRAVLKRKGDVALSAHARQQIRRRVYVGAAGVALIGLGVWLFFALQPPTGGGPRVAYPAVVHCMACGQREVARLSTPKARFPLKCSRCGETAAYKVWECRNCGTQFVPKGEAAEIACPKCRANRVGTAEALSDAPEPDGNQ